MTTVETWLTTCSGCGDAYLPLAPLGSATEHTLIEIERILNDGSISEAETLLKIASVAESAARGLRLAEEGYICSCRGPSRPPLVGMDDLPGSNVFVVYRIFDQVGQVLYIGCSTNVSERLKAHRATSWWRESAHSVTTEVFDTPREMRSAEVRAIRSESPVYNVRRYRESTYA